MTKITDLIKDNGETKRPFAVGAQKHLKRTPTGEV